MMKKLLCFLLLSLGVATVSCESGQFWHVTDFHYDFSYGLANLSCNGPVTRFGQFGDFWCDSPWKLAESAVENMKVIRGDVDFIIWTGDSVLHTTDDNLSEQINDHILTNLTSLLKNTFTNIPVYASFGNHDYFPNNQYPSGGNDLYNRTLNKWSTWINDTSQDSHFLKGAYYTVKTPYGLRIIALNTNLYYTSNKQTANMTDPSGQFSWLQKALESSRTASEPVIITAHIPPGVTLPNGRPWMYDHYNKKLNDIIRDYSDVIKATYYGHEHQDGFRIHYKSGKPVVAQYLAPSVTPWRYKIKATGEIGNAHNPGVRLVTFNRTTGECLQIEQFYMDLEESNKQGKAIWKSEYNMTQGYNIDDLSPLSLDKLSKSMEAQNSQQFQQYWLWKEVSPPKSLHASYDDTYKLKSVCAIQNVYWDDYKACTLKGVNGVSNISFSSTSLLVFVGLTVFYIVANQL